MWNPSFDQVLFNSCKYACAHTLLDIINEILLMLVLKMIYYWFDIWTPSYTFIHSNSLSVVGDFICNIILSGNKDMVHS